MEHIKKRDSNRSSRVVSGVPSGVHIGTLSAVTHDKEQGRIVITWQTDSGPILRDFTAVSGSHSKLVEVASAILCPHTVPLDSLRSILKAISKARGRPYYLAYTHDPERRCVGGSLSVVPVLEAQEAAR
jgi:hypothetical protein